MPPNLDDQYQPVTNSSEDKQLVVNYGNYNETPVTDSSTKNPYDVENTTTSANTNIGNIIGVTAGAFSYNSAPKFNSGEIVNVVDNYDWTSSINKQSFQTKSEKIPFIRLAEYKVLPFTLISSLVNTAIAGLGTATTITSKINSLKEKIKDISIGDTNTQNSGNTNSNVLDSIKKLGGVSSSVMSKFGENKTVQESINILTTAVKNNDILQDQYDALKPYKYLYLGEKTGKVFVMPYFEDKYFEGQSEWNTVDTVGDKFKATKELVSAVTEGKWLADPGVYNLTPKMFSFDSTSRTSVNVKFPLLNTLSVDSIQRNINLIFDLVTINKPTRKNPILNEVPSIFKVEIPGKAVYPYTYISAFTITHLGTKRLVDNITIAGKNTSIIVPDAYMLELNISLLTEDSSNFIYAALENKIEINTR